MKEVYEEELVEVKTKLINVRNKIQTEAQRLTAERHLEEGVCTDASIEQEWLADDFARAMEQLERQYSQDGFKASAVYVNYYDHLIEMLGPTEPDWKALLQNLADQISVHHIRHGVRSAAATAATMDFQVFPDDRSKHISTNLDEGADVDQTMVLRSP